jgi:hypothetical protein
VYAISSSPLRDICPNTIANPSYIRHVRPPSICLHLISHAQLRSHVWIQQSTKNINHSIQSAVEHVIHSRKYTINQPPPLTVSTITPGVSRLASRDPTTSAISCQISPKHCLFNTTATRRETNKKRYWVFWYLQIGNHGLFVLSLGDDAEEACIGDGYALEIAVFAC